MTIATRFACLLLAAFLCVGNAAFAQHAYQAVEGSYIVSIPAANKLDVLQGLKSVGVHVQHEYADGRFDLRNVSPEMVEELETWGVRFVPNLIFQAAGTMTTQGAGWTRDMVTTSRNSLDGAYAVPTGENRVFAYIFDTGVEPSPQWGNRLLPGRNFLDGENPTDTGAAGGNTHGTRVASLVASEDFGVAPGAFIVPVKIGDEEGYFLFSDILESAEWVLAHNAAQGNPSSVATMSFGGFHEPGFQDPLIAQLAATMSVFASVGNDGAPADDHWPSSNQGVIGVGAVDREYRFAGFSNYGYSVDILAIGVSTETHAGYLSGTSAATPVAAGVAAVKLSLGRLTPDELRAAVLADASVGVISGVPERTANVTAFVASSQLVALNCQSSILKLGGRFDLSLSWKAPQGATACANPRAIDGVEDSGLFYFSNPNNLEVLAKALDACPLNNRFWLFFAATTNVEFALVVTDTVTGEQKFYYNGAGQRANAVTDTTAFATCDG